MVSMRFSHWTHGLIPWRLNHVKLIAQKGPAMAHRISLSPILATARDDLRSRRASRTARMTLARELASYSTPAEQIELDAILDRADPEAADEIRHLIHRSCAV
jgi:hypothetical protein